MEWSGGLQEKVVRREETLPAGRGRCQRRPGGSVGGRSVAVAPPMVGLGFFFLIQLGIGIFGNYRETFNQLAELSGPL